MVLVDEPARAAEHPLPGSTMIGNRFHSVARGASILSIGLGMTGLARWMFDRSTLVSVGPQAATTLATPAIGLILAGASLLPRITRGGSWRAWFSRTCALGTMAIGMATLAGSALGFDLGIDQVLMRAPDAAGPGHMAPNTALGLALAGAALALLDMRFRVLRTVSQGMAITLLLIGLVACTGDVVGIGGPYDIRGSPSMPIHTAAGFTALSLGILLARPQGGILAVIAQDNAAGAMIRRLLPLIVVTPLAVAWVRLKGQEAGFYGPEFGLVLMVTTSTVILGFCAVWNSRVQGALETARNRALQDHRFLFELSDLLGVSTAPGDVLFRVAERLGEYLGASRCAFVELDVARDRATVRRDYHRGVSSLAGTVQLSLYSPKIRAAASAGHTIVSNDALTDERTDGRAEAYVRAGMRASIAVPLLRDGRWVSALLVSARDPRTWLALEVALIKAVAERTWRWLDHVESVDALGRREQDLAAAMNSIDDAVITTDGAGRVSRMNAAAERLTGWQHSDAVARPVDDVFRTLAEGTRTPVNPPVERVLRDGKAIDLPDRVVLVARDGAEHPIADRAAPIRAADGTVRGAVLVFRDAELEKDPHPGVQIDSAEDPAPGRRRLAVAHQFLAQLRGLNRDLEAQVRDRNAQLSALLREREVLLQEVHHRVKNNLQVIASLINMQIRRRESGAPRNGLAECKARVDAIALIHEKLYQTGNYACVQFSDYARNLASHVFSTTGVSPARVTLAVDVDSIALPVDKAIPCGLILNELLANALEHAFPGDRRGTVRVELAATAGGDIRLSVSDDGVGMAPDIEPARATSLGMHLVSTLVEQLDGHLEVIRHNGTRFWITFR